MIDIRPKTYWHVTDWSYNKDGELVATDGGTITNEEHEESLKGKRLVASELFGALEFYE